MSDVKRYNLVSYGAKMEEANNGNFRLNSDYESLQEENKRLREALMGNLKDIEIGDYVKIEYTEGRRMKGSSIKGKVIEITPTHRQIKVDSGWCAHAGDKILEHIKANEQEQALEKQDEG